MLMLMIQMMWKTLNSTALGIFLMVNLVLIYGQPQQSDEDMLSVSSEDELGISLTETVLSTSVPDDFSFQLSKSESELEDKLGISLEQMKETGFHSHSFCSDVCRNKSSSESEDELGMSLNHYSDSCEDLFGTDSPLQFSELELVKAKTSTPKPKKKLLSAEISSGKSLKKKALSSSSIKSALKEKCTCGGNCMQKVNFGTVKNIRLHFWMNARNVRMQLLKYHLSHSKKVGKFRMMNINSELKVCSSSFRHIFRVDKNTFSRGLDMYKRDVASIPGKKPRDSNEATVMLINWFEDYATFHGDRMPDSKDILLPYKTKKITLFEKYRNEATELSHMPVSRSLFYMIWQEHFPHLKIKKTNSFSKCTTCVTLERQMEKTTCIETRMHYRLLRMEHNDRQMNERRYYYSKRESSRRYPSSYMSLIIDGMDQSKTNLPHFTGRMPKNINPADLLKTHVTGVINHGHGGFSTFLDINDFPHDPNLTMNILLKCFKKTAEINEHYLPPICYIQADNCARENKNKYVLAFCELLVAEKIFTEVHLSFLYVGHTHEDVDAAFSKISDSLRTTDAETMEDLLNLLPNVERLVYLYDIKAWLLPHINNIHGQSQPLHYKFIRTEEQVNAFFKGKHSDPWIPLNNNILKSLPAGDPEIIYQDFKNIDVEKQTKQIEVIKTFFEKRSSYEKWICFYNTLNSISERRCVFLLNELPRQKTMEKPFVNNVPPEVRELVQKEVHIPRVIVNKGITSTDNKKTNKRRYRAPKDNKNGTKKRQRRLIKMHILEIPLTGEIKKHIWIKIFMELTGTFNMLMLLFIIIILAFLGYLYAIIEHLNNLLLKMIFEHIGCEAFCRIENLLFCSTPNIISA